MVMAPLSWVLVVLGLLVGALAAAGKVLPVPWRRAGEEPRRIANSALLLSSPLVRGRVRRRRYLHALLGVLLVIGLVSAALVAGRPVDRSVRSDALASRDIVLCLDVSTSMLSVDVQILDTFTKLLDTFEFRPTLYNPMSDKYSQTFSGTMLTDVQASSLVGDGLASCSLAFDANQVEDRSRSIVLASDNQVVDPDHQQVYSLNDAADLSARENIRLFSLFGSDPSTVDPSLTGMTLTQARENLKTVTEDHSGFFYEVDDPKAVERIVKELEADQATMLEGDSEVRVTDVPQGYAVWLVTAVVALLVVTAWRRA